MADTPKALSKYEGIHNFSFLVLTTLIIQQYHTDFFITLMPPFVKHLVSPLSFYGYISSFYVKYMHII